MDDILGDIEKHAARCWQETEPVVTCANTRCTLPASDHCALHITIGEFVLDIVFCSGCYWRLQKTLEGW